MIKFKKYFKIFLLTAIFPFSAHSQGWQSYPLASFVGDFEGLNVNQNINYQYSLIYRTYSDGPTSSLNETANGLIIKKNKSIFSTIDGITTTLHDDDITITIDSVEQSIFITYNVFNGLQGIVDELGDDKILKNIEQIFISSSSSEIKYKIIPKSNSQIEYYLFSISKAKTNLREIGIQYATIETKIYNKESEFNRPYLSISYSELKNKDSEKFLSRNYFITELSDSIKPSQNFPNYKIYDLRVNSVN